MANFFVKGIHEAEGFEYTWNLSYDEFCQISEAFQSSSENQAVLILVHTCYGAKIIRVTSLLACDSEEFERCAVSPLWLTVVNQEEIGEYIPDFFPSDDCQEEEEEIPHRIEEEEPFETYSIPCGWDIERIIWFFKSEVARQYLTATLYYEGVLGDGVNKVVIRESESHNEKNEVATWDKLAGTLSITC